MSPSLRPFVLSLLSCIACSSPRTEPTQPRTIGVAGDGRLAAVLEDIRSTRALPALAAVLVAGDSVIESAATGLRAAGFSEAATAADHWHIGSLTKAMTATLAAVLIERGDVAWTTTIGEVFPDLIPTMRPAYATVRLDELLSHTAGMSTDLTEAPSWDGLRHEPGEAMTRRRRFVAELLTLAPAGARGRYAYSNAGYVIAGAMLEERTGQLWESLMDQLLFGPLEMTSTAFGAPGTPNSRSEPWGHLRQAGGYTPVSPGPLADNPDVVGPAGTVHTTLADYAAYLKLHLAGARGIDGLVPAASFIKLHTPAPGTSYALGWAIGDRSWAGGRVLQHAGSNTLWFAVTWVAPERNLAMFAVTNAAGDQAQLGTDEAVGALIGRFEASGR